MSYSDFARHRIIGLDKARVRSARRTGKKYFIEVSEDAGSTYHIVHTSDDLEFLQQIGDDLDSKSLRWAIKDSSTGTMLDHCSIYQSIIDDIKGMEEGED